ncbi:hypothetical protein SAMN05445756_2124 [Kytococcus aerolatus]|uniref:Secreted protein n=1 Tax=Kytococcus aerolatus TaxID=592308 RepID=A0A212U699_9MICO|nr:hypothetical protein [Kytococcus aerolatus]SNC73749.1 hypothetical protein SAMN05445756_2124 [Kytococcus aerolatus]
MTNISRRAVAKGAAWSAPSVLVAAQAPSLAASPGSPEPSPDKPIVAAGPGGGSCKLPGESRGQKAYRVEIDMTNISGSVGTVEIMEVTARGGAIAWAPDEAPIFTIEPGGDRVAFYIRSADSANVAMTVTYLVVVDGREYVAESPVELAEFPPCEKSVYSPWE